MNVTDAIRLKRAVRKLTVQPLPEETTLAILNAGEPCLPKTPSPGISSRLRTKKS